MKPKILLVDNIPEFLGIQARLLEQEGYDVLTASNIVAAETFLKQDWFHLVIIDQRMEDENNEHDISGLVLARKEEFRSIPKIILTAYPDYESAVGALGTIKGYPSAFDYIAKQKGPKILSEAVAHFFSHHVHINLGLTFDWKAGDPLALANLVETGLGGERLLNRAEELEGLFRRLFYEKEHVRLDRLLWQYNGRVALVVFAFKEGAKPESFVVVCGQNAIVHQEVQRFNEFAPKAPGDNGTMLGEKMRAETTHFAANAYTLAGNDLENVQTLAELYRGSPEKAFNAALSVLYQETLKVWHEEKPVRQRGGILESLYRQQLQLTDNQEDLEERLKVIETQIPTLETKIERTRETLSLHFKSQSFTYPNPISLPSHTVGAEQPALLINVPGMLSGDNILTDTTGHAWLTDFAEAGLAPLLWNYVTLEAAIRFDWVETKELQRRHELEHCLIFSDFARLDMSELEPVVRKPTRAIQVIRKLAARTVGREEMAYHLGIYFHAARRLGDFNPAYPLTSTELARLAHVVFSMAMIAKKIGKDKDETFGFASTQADELRILDETARKILVGNREVVLARQPFALFHYLFLNSNRVCTKVELVKNVLKNEYNEYYLHTLIGRVRNAIENDPDKPRFLITEPSVGYRLIPKPE
ncbi:MAG TPA: DNA-binding response regulator [Candidatus Hydrogenedentes bacterium]|nr:DNA-binding response regulator [Candidatus Hydrogenedentota bacterium]